MSYDSTTKKSTNYTSPKNLFLGGAQLINGTLYAASFSADSSTIVSGALADGKYTTIKNTEDGAGFLTQLNTETNNPDYLMLMAGRGGTENSFSLSKVKVTDGEKTKLFSPGGFSAYLLGWGKDYDSVIYMDDLSLKSEIRQYTISTNKDVLLQSGIPLVHL